MTRSLLAAFFCVAVVCALSNAKPTAAATPLLLQNPTISSTQIAFTYGGNIWTVPRDGGTATRLVTGYDLEGAPYFSPDGRTIAFSGTYDGITGVYVVPASGGEPLRLTSHPDGAIAVGWTPDGKNVLYRSTMLSTNDPDMLFTVPATGGYPTRLPLPEAETGSYSSDGTHLAYVPNFRYEPFWKGYRGGQTTPVYIAKLADSSIVKVPRDNSNDDTPMWVGKDVYFLSDRGGPITLYDYDTDSKRVSRVFENTGFDITGASAGPGAIVYSQFGDLHVYDLATHTAKPVPVEIAADLPQVRSHWERVGTQIENANVSPSGVRGVFEAHGQIFTVPVEHGDVRNISDAPHTANRDPAWSPDGKSIAYFSDASGEYKLEIRDQRGLVAPRSIDLGNAPSYFYSPTWSPDSKKIAYTDKHHNLYYVDLGHPTPVKVVYSDLSGGFEEAWSPDSKYLVYTDVLSNYLHAAFLYDLATGRKVQITDGQSDVRYPTFDAGGKYLYFTASTNVGLTSAGFDMVSDQHPVSSLVYAMVLKKSDPSPVKPQTADEASKPAPSSDEPGDAAPSAAPSPQPTKKPTAKGPVPTAIDFDGLQQRVVALPIPEANYVALAAGKAGELFTTQAPIVSNSEGPVPLSVDKFALATLKSTPVVSDINGAVISANGEKILYAQGPRWSVADTAHPVGPGNGTALNTSAMEVYVDPPAEWKQMYHEVWRIERDFFYDPHYHGLDLRAAEQRFEPYLAGVSSRSDLNFLFQEMLSYLSVGHMFVRGGTQPAMPHINVGLLGADYAVENDRYRFTKIYRGQNWDPEVKAPLVGPGIDVAVGDYLIAVNGHHIAGTDDLYGAFEETAGKQTIVTVSSQPSGAGGRDVTVVPIANEFSLRNDEWIDDNRRKVDELSGGKLGYVYLPDTEYGGFTNFNRYFFAAVGKQGVIVDERFNHGGQLADYIVDYLARKPLDVTRERDGRLEIDPPLAIFGPKVMLINQYAGSGGDALPWIFHREHVGTLVGVRTWGGLVGIGGYPPLIDGGSVTAPRFAIGGLHGQWEVENHGVAPDIEVMQDPKLVREGHDPQLEAGVAEALRQLREHPVPTFPQPPYPDHKPVLPPG
jgi:tricorn protease